MARLYLLISAGGVFLAALSYGLAPHLVLPIALDVTVDGTDMTHIFRAIMGLYLGMAVFWLLGAFRESLTRSAVLAVIFFMVGLAAGRLLSIVIDGPASSLLLGYAALEIAIGLWGIFVLRRLDAA